MASAEDAPHPSLAAEVMHEKCVGTAGLTEVLRWHSTRAGIAHRRIRHLSNLSSSHQRLLRLMIGRVIHDDRRPMLKIVKIPTLRQSNNCQGDRRTLEVARSGLAAEATSSSAEGNRDSLCQPGR
jgi:hypothetical protein